jgi:hypothetical protein
VVNERAQSRRMGRLSMGLLLGTLAAGCTSELVPRTELMLVADTDIPLDDIRQMGFSVIDRKGVEKRYDREMVTYADLPLTLALEHAGGELGPVTVAAFAVLGDDVFVRTHEVNFVPGKTMVVPLHLSASCVANDPCLDEVCTETGECQPALIDELEPWTGAPPRMNPAKPAFDASTDPVSEPDAGAGEDASVDDGTQVCDGVTYSKQDDQHCGDCDTDCTERDDEDGAIMKHIRGVCGADRTCVRACVDGFVSCSGPKNLNGNGCETEADAENTCDTCACGG